MLQEERLEVEQYERHLRMLKREIEYLKAEWNEKSLKARDEVLWWALANKCQQVLSEEQDQSDE